MSESSGLNVTHVTCEKTDGCCDCNVTSILQVIYLWATGHKHMYFTALSIEEEEQKFN